MRERFTENTYYPADLEWRNIRVRNAAVRMKGLATRNPIKLGLRVDFERYTAGQRFLGMRSLLLDNLWTDPSMVRERVSMALFARLGQPAPRESFGRLYINNVFQGVYALVEDVDSTFVSRTIDDGTGYSTSITSSRRISASFSGEDLEAYKPRFEARSHEQEPDAAVYGPIGNCSASSIRPTTRRGKARWTGCWISRSSSRTSRSRRSSRRTTGYSAPPAWRTSISIDSPTATGTGSSSSTRTPRSSDVRFSAVTRTGDNVIFRRAFAVPRLRTLYFQVLEDCARAAAENGWFEAEINRALAVIDAAAREDPRKQFLNEAFDQKTASMREFARTRPAIVLEEVGRLRSGR